MANEPNSLSGKVGLDTSDFKTNVAAMNRELRVLESGFKASAAALGDWSKSITGLESRAKSLTEELTIQERKVAATRAEYNRLAAEQGENSRAAQDMQIKLNRETEQLNKMNFELQTTQSSLDEMRQESIGASREVDDLGDESRQTDRQMEGLRTTVLSLTVVVGGLTASVRGLAGVLSTELAVALGVLKVGAGAVLGLGAAAFIAGGLMTGLTLSAANSADKLGELAVQTGFSVEQLQEFNYIGTIVGTSLDTITGANTRLIRAMDAARTRTSDQAKAFTALGVSVVDADGNLRDSNVVFGEVIDALGKVKNPTEADALALQLFGRSAQELNPLIREGAAGLQELTDAAHENGAIISTETIGVLGDLQDKFDAIKLGLQGVGSSFAVAFAPVVGGMLDQAQGDLQELVSIVQGSGGDFSKMAEGLQSLFTRIAEDVAAQAPAMLNAGLLIIQSLVGAMIDALPSLLESAVGIVNTLITFIVQNLPLLAQAALALITTLINSILPELPMLVDVGLQIITTLINALVSQLPTLIPKLATTGTTIVSQILTAITTAFPKLLPVAVQLIQTFIGFLRNNLTELIEVGIPMIEQIIAAILPQLPLLLDAAIAIIVALANGIAEQLPLLLPVVAEVLNELAQVFFDNAPLLLDAGGKLLIAIIDGLTAALPILLTPAGQNTINALIKALGDVAAELLPALGGALLAFITTGITAALPVFAASFRTSMFGQFAQFLVDMRAKVLEIGKNIVTGIWQGILNERASFLANITKFFTDIVNSVKKALGIASPSKVFAEMGRFSAQGFGVGFQESFEQIRRQMRGAVGSLAPAFAGAGGISNVSTSNESFAFYAPVVIQDTSTGTLGETLKTRRF